MPSKALDALLSSVQEIGYLLKADAVVPGAVPKDPLRSRAIGRASVVLLSSHFERYLFALFEEVVAYLNLMGIDNLQIPPELRLLHSKASIEEIAETAWNNRAQKLEAFVASEAWLWTTNASIGTFSHIHLLDWMKSPKTRNLLRMFKYWGVNDIFQSVTARSHTRQDLVLRIEELVDKRNNIAHGDFATEATPREVKLYSLAVTSFCERADRRMSIQLSRLFKITRPW
ncbi:MAG TPA: MAE_28990/MAE_18760 family HEPN-like nuclease [Bryobacteraceae bacterium]